MIHKIRAILNTVQAIFWTPLTRYGAGAADVKEGATSGAPVIQPPDDAGDGDAGDGGAQKSKAKPKAKSEDVEDDDEGGAGEEDPEDDDEEEGSTDGDDDADEMDGSDEDDDADGEAGDDDQDEGEGDDADEDDDEEDASGLALQRSWERRLDDDKSEDRDFKKLDVDFKRPISAEEIDRTVRHIAGPDAEKEELEDARKILEAADYLVRLRMNDLLGQYHEKVGAPAQETIANAVSTADKRAEAARIEAAHPEVNVPRLNKAMHKKIGELVEKYGKRKASSIPLSDILLMIPRKIRAAAKAEYAKINASKGKGKARSEKRTEEELDADDRAASLGAASAPRGANGQLGRVSSGSGKKLDAEKRNRRDVASVIQKSKVLW